MAKSAQSTAPKTKTTTSAKRLQQLRQSAQKYRTRLEQVAKSTIFQTGGQVARTNSRIISDFKAHVMTEVKRLAIRTFRNGYRAGQQYLMRVRDQEHDEVALEDHRSALTHLAKTMQGPTLTRAMQQGWSLKG